MPSAGEGWPAGRRSGRVGWADACCRGLECFCGGWRSAGEGLVAGGAPKVRPTPLGMTYTMRGGRQARSTVFSLLVCDTHTTACTSDSTALSTWAFR
jgi:hypothetical protein